MKCTLLRQCVEKKKSSFDKTDHGEGGGGGGGGGTVSKEFFSAMTHDTCFIYLESYTINSISAVSK